ncbi:hypothetical protein ACQPYA_19100 [Micromonospora sp. CA-263727]|uniref:hypothetical protein n=1 Tax=Micromonospora sp. CA-263727 TaxID=3239967 RepID=UPI003D8B3EE1
MNAPSFSGLGRFLDTQRQTLLTVLTVLELLILLAVLLRWFDRRYGLRSTGRRILRGVAEVAWTLVAPLVGFLRLRRGMRVVAERFADPGPVPAARAGIVSARLASGGRDDVWPYLVLLDSAETGVRLAGPGAHALRPAAESPWRVTVPGSWRARRALAPVSGLSLDTPLPVAVGVRVRELVLLDLRRCPGIVSVHGAPTPADRLVSAMVVQLAALVGGHGVDRLIVAVEPGEDELGTTGTDRMPLSAALTTIAARPAASVGCAVLVCRRPDGRTAAQLAALVSGCPGVLVLVAGYLPGSRWRLRVDTAGRVVAPDLALDAESTPLVRALRRVRRPASPAAAAPAWAAEGPPRSEPVEAASSAPAEDPAPDSTEPASPAASPHAPPRPALVTPLVDNDDLFEGAAEQRPVAHSGVESADRPGGR